MRNRKPDNSILTIPNLLSLVRLGLIPGIVRLYCRGNASGAGMLLILSALTDILDGFIARRCHMTSDLGKVLDPAADKLTQGAVLLCLMLRFPDFLWPLGLMVAKELFMTISGLLVVRRTGTVPGANWHGKAATVLLYGTMLLHVFWEHLPRSLSRASIAACCCMILISLLLYGMRNLQLLKEAQGTGSRT